MLGYLICAILLPFVVSTPPRLMPIPQLSPLNVGSSLILVCAAQEGSEPLTFQWIKNENLLPKETSQFNIETTSRDSLLRVNRMKTEHAGNYTCKVTNTYGEDRKTVTVVVKAPLKWIKEPSDVHLVVGEFRTLRCDATGAPHPEIQWLKNGIVILSGNSSLEIRKADMIHAGNYECRATNGMDSDLRKAFHVRIQIPAKFEEKYTLIRARAGGSAKLSCPATGDQLLSISWTRDDVNLRKPGGEKFEILDHVTKKGLTSELLLRSVRRDDSAVYKCKAENEYGSDERVMKLMVLEVPGPPKNVRAKETWSRSASIGWTAPHDGNSPITNYTLQYWIQQAATRRLNEATVTSSQTTALLKDLKPGSSYELTIFAQNEVGHGETSESITFLTNQEEPGLAPIDVTAQPKGPTSIRVTWRAPPRDEWNGELLGYYVGYRVRGSTMPFSFTSTRAAANSDIYYEYEFMLTDLLMETAYDIVIKAYNAAGSGPQSHEMHVQTLNANLPKAPHLAVDSSTKSTISMWWRSKASPEETSRITSYVLHYRRDNEEWRLKRVSATSSTPASGSSSSSVQSIVNYVLVDLESGSRYSLYVNAINSYGMGDASNLVETETSGDRVFFATSFEGSENVPYYLQPLVTIPILTAFVIIILVVLITYACVRRMKSQIQSQEACTAFNTLNSKNFAHLGTMKFDNSCKPLMCEGGNIFPSPYATLPMDAKCNEDGVLQKPWDRPLPNPKAQNMLSKNPHIYDNPQ